MKTVKIEDAIKAWRETGRKCKPKDSLTASFSNPFIFYTYMEGDADFILQPLPNKETRSLFVNIYKDKSLDCGHYTIKEAEDYAAKNRLECREIKYDVEIPEE